MSTPTRPPSVFDEWSQKYWPHRFTATLTIDDLHGGTPSDPKVIEGWLRSKTTAPDDAIRDQVVETMLERGLSVDEATEAVASLRSLVGFKKDAKGLYIEGRQLKAALKESAAVALAAGHLPTKMGSTHKGTISFMAEHLSVVESKLYLTRDGKTLKEPDEVRQAFVHTFRGASIKMSEVVERCHITATIETDVDLGDDAWGALWTAGERQGIGANRSQGAGRYSVTNWQPLRKKRSPRKAA